MSWSGFHLSMAVTSGTWDGCEAWDRAEECDRNLRTLARHRGRRSVLRRSRSWSRGTKSISGRTASRSHAGGRSAGPRNGVARRFRVGRRSAGQTEGRTNLLSAPPVLRQSALPRAGAPSVPTQRDLRPPARPEWTRPRVHAGNRPLTPPGRSSRSRPARGDANRSGQSHRPDRVSNHVARSGRR